MSKQIAHNEDRRTISGFSKLSKRGKIRWIVENFFKDPEKVMHELMSYWHHNEDQQKILDAFSENTISNFPLPFSVAPNFQINGKLYCVPLVTEESSVVAAASSGAKFWLGRGGIHAEVLGTTKLGQIHFKWKGSKTQLEDRLHRIKMVMEEDAFQLMKNMKSRGGGIGEIQIRQLEELENYWQLLIEFETCDSMGANFINSCLESFSLSLERCIGADTDLYPNERSLEIIMSILSNYTPDCLVKAWVECEIKELGQFADNMSAREFAERFKLAIDIAKRDPYRAVTHNKGIFNGIDAVVLATANDYRAIEACGHAYAARDGQYSSLSSCSLDGDRFYFELKLPLALGTVGGLTALHPMAKTSLELLEHPTARDLMLICAATGLAQNFSAVRSLVTTGIQYGHMKMHLQNIILQLQANENEAKMINEYFSDKKISYQSVNQYLDQLRASSAF